MRSFWIALALAGAIAAPLRAQKAEKVPRRPKLDATADTNSASAYYFYGLQELRQHPDRAADAFYWASRLEPAWAEPLYGRRTAILLSDRRRLQDFVLGRDYVHNSADVKRADSLFYNALLLNPFLHRALDRILIEEVIEDVTGERPIGDWARDNPDMAAWLAYSRGQFGSAAPYYAEAIKRHPKAFWLRDDRAQNFFMMGQYDSSLTDMSILIDSLRSREDKKVVLFYQSKAMYEYSVGMIHVQRKDLAAARDAFGRALAEDLSFYMAHARLADVAFALADTAGALTELDLAVQLAGEDPTLRYRYGLLLLGLAKHEGAALQFEKAIKANPDYAPPYVQFARLLEAYGDQERALANYQDYVARAPRSEQLRTWAEGRAKALADAGVTPIRISP
jgi:tetratricopeptide (TPR) repeat protein